MSISWNTGLAAERARFNLKLKKKKRKKRKATSPKPQAPSCKLQAPSKESSWLPQNPWYKIIMSRSLKPEFQPGGAKRQYILDKAVEYILEKNPKLGTQNSRHAFLVEQVGLSQTEYLEALNRATNGGVVKAATGE